MLVSKSLGIFSNDIVRRLSDIGFVSFTLLVFVC